MANDSALKCFTLNSRGLRSRCKRKALFTYLKGNKFDVVCLQETHVTDDVCNQWEREWGKGHFVSNNFSSHSCGQIILFRKNLVDTYNIIYNSKRILAVEVEVLEKSIAIVNVYAPNNNMEKTCFFEELNNVISNITAEGLLICGDFNCVLDNKLDIISGGAHSNVLVPTFHNVIYSHDLYDVWRLFHPQEKQYTWSKKNPFIARRLDYILSNSELFNRTIVANIHSLPSTDHRGCAITVKLTNCERGPGQWKFNNSLLKNIDFVSKMNTLINEHVSSIEKESDYQLEWEMLKVKIKSFTTEE